MCKCKVCNREIDSPEMQSVTVRFSEWDGFCSSNYNDEVCFDCYFGRFINSHGTSFLKIDNKIYISNICGTYEKANSDKDIDRAFNPDRYAFNEWLRK